MLFTPHPTQIRIRESSIDLLFFTPYIPRYKILHIILILYSLIHSNQFSIFLSSCFLEVGNG
jgi:hypothetical protein